MKVLHKFLLTITPKARVISVIFRGEHRKNDAELLSTFTSLVYVRFLINLYHPEILATHAHKAINIMDRNSC